MKKATINIYPAAIERLPTRGMDGHRFRKILPAEMKIVHGFNPPPGWYHKDWVIDDDDTIWAEFANHKHEATPQPPVETKVDRRTLESTTDKIVAKGGQAAEIKTIATEETPEEIKCTLCKKAPAMVGYKRCQHCRDQQKRNQQAFRERQKAKKQKE